MNIGTKSLLIGLGVTIIYCGFALLKKNKTALLTYTYQGHYVVQVHPKEHALTGGVQLTDKVTQILKARITGAYAKPKVKTVNDQELDLAISSINDTNQITRLITANSSLEFREMYTLQEASNYFLKIMPLLGYSKDPAPEPEEKTVDATTKDSSLVRYSDTDPSPAENLQPSFEPLILFSQPYQPSSGQIRYLPSIGMVKIKDTTVVNSVLQREEFVKAIPPDLKVVYGPIIEKFGEKNKDYLYLYAIRAWPDKPAILDNDDIISARQDYSQTGIPEINFQFNPVAARKWERMTTDNIGKPIAIILDNEVISAPNVNGTISEGYSSISGGFTVMEAQDLAVLLNSSSMPATTSIINHEIKRERVPKIPGNPLLYFIVFVAATGFSYLIIHLLKNN